MAKNSNKSEDKTIFQTHFNLSSLNGTNGFRLDGVNAGDLSGRSVATAGDVNGDGLADVIIGAVGASPNGQTSAGSSYVVFGRGTTISPTAFPTPVPSASPTPFSVPQMVVNQLIIQNGQTLVLNSSHLLAVNSQAVVAFNLVFVVSNIQNGQFAIVNQLDHSVSSFTQLLIENSQIVFIHAGNRQAPFYTVVVTDGSSFSLPSTPTIYFADAPLLQSASLLVQQNQSVILNASNFNVIVPAGVNASLLQFTLSNINNGYFTVNGTAATQFTQQNINQNQVQFVPDGSNTSPSYTVTVTNLVSNTSSVAQPANVLFQTSQGYFAPRIQRNQLFIIQGKSHVLTKDDLYVVDESNNLAPGNTLFTPMNWQHGAFYFTNRSTVSPATFTQTDVLTGAIQFTHDGSKGKPNYQFVAQSSQGVTSSVSTALITFEIIPHAPVDSYGMLDQTVTVGQPFAIVAKIAGTVVNNSVGLTTTVRNFIIGAVVSGVIGLGFFGLSYCVNKRMKNDLRDVLKVTGSETEQQDDAWKRETLLPFAREFFDRLKTTGLCCYRNKQDTANYLSALTTLLIAIKRNGIETDLKKLTSAERHHIIHVTITEIQKELVSKPKCCSRPWFFQFTRPNVTPAQLDNKAPVIAKAVAERLQREMKGEASAVEMSEVRFRGKKIAPQQEIREVSKKRADEEPAIDAEDRLGLVVG